MYRKLILLTLVVVALLGVSAAQAQTNYVWNVQFFNDIFLSSSPVVNRQDTAPSLAYNWGAGSPATGVNADNFGARFGTDAYFAAGTYRFSAQVDDGVRVYVDYVPVIDTLDAPRPGTPLTADVTLGAGVHHIQVDFREYGGDAYLYFGWSSSSGTTVPTPSGSINSGTWIGQYYANTTLSGTPTLIQSESSPSHNWASGSPVVSIPVDNWSARWTSQQTLSAGTYTMTVTADDGVRLYINGITYINEFHLASANTYTASVTLPAGLHTFVVEFYESGGIAFLSYNLTLGGATTVPTATPSLTGSTATVTAFRLNVRAAPDPINGAILTKISKNETYQIVGRNGSSSWWQLNVNGIIGWVNGRYVTALNTGNVPITSGGTQGGVANCPGAPLSRLVVGGRGRVTTGAGNNLREAPAVTATRIGRIPALGVFTVLAGPSCYGGYAYWQVNYNGRVGWTAEGFGSEYWLEPTQ